jgi:N-6 DNA Methylase
MKLPCDQHCVVPMGQHPLLSRQGGAALPISPLGRIADIPAGYAGGSQSLAGNFPYFGPCVAGFGRRSLDVKLKPEVRHSGGVYYTPQHIVDAIVDRTVGKRLEQLIPSHPKNIKILDPACGSGSFLIRAFEKLCQACLEYFAFQKRRSQLSETFIDRNGDIQLTSDFKKRIVVD